MDLHDAVRDGNYERLERLIGTGCPVDQLDHKGMTPLAYASQSAKATAGVLKLLIDSGADPSLAVSEAGANIRYLSIGKYSIVVHCIYGLYENEDLCNMIQFLHANGADLNAESDCYKTDH